MATPNTSQKDASIKLLNSINNAVLLATGKPWVFPVESKEQFKDLVKWLFTFQVENFVSSEIEEILKQIDNASDMVSLTEIKKEVIESKNPIVFKKFNEKSEQLS